VSTPAAGPSASNADVLSTYAHAEQHVRPWATSPSANAHWLDDTTTWALRTKRKRWWSLRRHRVVFPRPNTLDDVADADRWEAIARVVAAEHTSNGAFGTWIGGIAAGLAFGLAGTAVADSTASSEAAYWVRLAAGILVAVVLFGIVTVLLVATTGRALVRAYEHGPMWAARADAYARRRRDLDSQAPDLYRREDSLIVVNSRWALTLSRRSGRA
jgi:hypothetical protein